MRPVEERLDELEKTVEELKGTVQRLNEAVQSKVLGEVLRSLQDRDKRRNKSSPTTRDMTDEDAENVLKGPCSELSHTDAGNELGLTYAQVYSCRLGHTFKHVHKRLRTAGWKNKWAK